MELTNTGFSKVTYDFFKTRYEMDFVYKIGAALVFAAFTGLMAQVRFYLPFTPVPITGQVLPALLAGFVLGKWYGGLSQALFAFLGGYVIPWGAPKEGMSSFTNGGVDWLFGTTGGYIAGFVLAAFFVGHFTDSYIKFRNPLPQLIIMLIGVLIIYTLGAFWLYVSLSGLSVGKVIAIGVVPFIPGDIVKAILAAGIGTAVLPRVSFANELDA